MRQTRPEVQTRAVARRFIVFVTLLAFCLQTYLTQTHIHFAAENRSAFSLEQNAAALFKPIAGTPEVPWDKFPPNDDPANCPLCQEILHAGHFVTPAAVAILLPFDRLSVIVVTAVTPLLAAAVTHIWRSRAPPLN